MLDLSATKLLILFVVAVVLLGPNRLPEVARQLGAGWKRLRDLHARVDGELRRAVPDLPSSHDLARLARSPVRLLDELASLSPQGLARESDAPVPDPAAPAAPAGGASPGGALAGRHGTLPPGAARPALTLQPSDDPGMN